MARSWSDWPSDSLEQAEPAAGAADVADEAAVEQQVDQQPAAVQHHLPRTKPL